MRHILLTTIGILALATPSFAVEPDKTVGQAPPPGASSFYVVQDTASMKCEVVGKQPAEGSGGMKVIGAAHKSEAEAKTALSADKTCK